MQNIFDPSTFGKIQSYVYALFSDDEKMPFYIGKGKENRVFNHVKCALKDDKTENLKYEKIRNSKSIKHLILRHGLKDDEAFAIESTLLDMFEYIEHPLTNIQGGSNAIEKGLMTSDEVIRRYNAEPLLKLPDNSIIININKNYPKKGSGDKDSIYKATKETWKIAKEKTSEIKYVLSEYLGRIVEVYEVEKWYENERTYTDGAKKAGLCYIGYGFDGKVAPESIRSQCLNKSIIKLKGSRNSFRYFLNTSNDES